MYLHQFHKQPRTIETMDVVARSGDIEQASAEATTLQENLINKIKKLAKEILIIIVVFWDI